MLRNITIGQYLATGSPIHKLNPRIKITIVVLYMASIFLVTNFIQYIPIVLALGLVCYVAKIPVSYILKGIKPLKFIIILTFLINALAADGRVLISFWIFDVTEEGLIRASFMAMRLVLLVVGTSLLTLTTSPTELTQGLEKIFSPLKKIGFPAHEIAMMLTIALRFIPTLIEETDKIMKAQKSRGADFESGNVLNRAKNLIPLLVPLFINSLRRADDLATAMESRCYRGGQGRTSLKDYSLGQKDFLALGLCLTFFVIVIIGGRILF